MSRPFSPVARFAYTTLIALLMMALTGCYYGIIRDPGGQSSDQSSGDDDDDAASNDDDSQPVGDDDDSQPIGDDDDDDDSQPIGDDDDDSQPIGDDDDDDEPPPASGPLCNVADRVTCGVTSSGSTVGAASNESTWSICGLDYGAGFTGGEAVWEWQAASSGTVNISLSWSDGNQDLDLFALSSCDLNGAACLGESTSGTPGESLSLNVVAGSWYYLVIDGWEGGAASYTLTINEDCDGNPGDDDDSVGDDDDDDSVGGGGDYGPSNTWDHVSSSDLPPGLSGTGWNNGDTAYNFTLTDQHGNQVELYQFYGHPIMLDIFAEWCGPCNDMAPDGEEIWEQSGEDVIVIALMQETSWASPPGASDAARWGTTHGLSHPILADPTMGQGQYASAYPTFVAIDSTMTIVDDDMWPPSLGYLQGL